MFSRYLQKQVKPNMLVLFMASLILLTVVAAYLYLLQKPLLERKRAQQTLELLTEEITQGKPLGSKIDEFQNKMATLNLQLRGSGPELPDNQMMTFVVGQLDIIAGQHDLKLVSIRPGATKKVFMFEEFPFNIELAGSYTKFFDWLFQIENELGPIVIKQFEIIPVTNSSNKHFKLTIVSYRLKKGNI